MSFCNFLLLIGDRYQIKRKPDNDFMFNQISIISWNQLIFFFVFEIPLLVSMPEKAMDAKIKTPK